MPFITKPFIDLLWDSSAESALTLATGPAGVTPLPGVYASSLSPIIRRFLREGHRDLRSLIGAAPSATIVPGKKVIAVDPNGQSFRNINTPSDLREAVLNHVL